MEELMQLPAQSGNGSPRVYSIVDNLNAASERLRQLAEELELREKAHAEMVANYPFFKRFFYAEMKKILKCEEEPPFGEDLEGWAINEGALPLDAFIDELEHPRKGV